MIEPADIESVLTDECGILLRYLRDPVFFVRVDDGRILRTNQAAADLYGYSLAQLREMRIFELIATENGETLRDATRDGEISEEGVLFEGRHRKADGTVFPVETSARLVTLDGERVILAILRDVSERKEAERALARAYDEIEQVVNSAADGMRIIDKDFNVVRINDTLTLMTRAAPESLLGSKCYDSFSGEACHTPGCVLERVMAGESIPPIEVRKRRADGTWIDTILTARPFRVDGETVGVIEDFRDITDRKLVEERAHFLATHDPLTWLPNRLVFQDHLALAIAAAERQRAQPGLLFCDVDEFKDMNDTFGHAAGDEALRLIAETLTATIRKEDTAARLGGDEFVVLLPSVHGDQDMEAVARKLLEAVRLLRVDAADSTPISLSIGGTLYEEGDTPDTFMRRADKTMYTAKDAGGDRYLLG